MGLVPTETNERMRDMVAPIILKPGESLMVVSINPDVYPSHPIMLPGMPGWGGGGPVDPGYSPPWAQIPPGGQGGGPVDPGYSPPWAQVPPQRPIAGWPIVPGWGGSLPGGGGFPGQGGPVDPGYSPPWAQIPVDPPTEPPPVKPPTEGGNWVWAWSPQLGRWVWVKVPGEGEAGPKT